MLCVAWVKDVKITKKNLQSIPDDIFWYVHKWFLIAFNSEMKDIDSVLLHKFLVCLRVRLRTEIHNGAESKLVQERQILLVRVTGSVHSLVHHCKIERRDEQIILGAHIASSSRYLTYAPFSSPKTSPKSVLLTVRPSF
jgi:hypothetical protein